MRYFDLAIAEPMTNNNSFLPIIIAAIVVLAIVAFLVIKNKK